MSRPLLDDGGSLRERAAGSSLEGNQRSESDPGLSYSSDGAIDMTALAHAVSERRKSQLHNKRVQWFVRGVCAVSVGIIALILVAYVIYEEEIVPAQLTAAERLRADYEDAVTALVAAGERSGAAMWERMAYISDRFGPRPAGSDALADAQDFILQELTGENLVDAAAFDDVDVPVWRRGNESAVMVAPRRQHLPILGLGGSVGTPAGGITAEVAVVSSLEGVDETCRGKIVVFNVPFTTYGDTVGVRLNAADAASAHGALAALVRSITPYSIASPHTGMMRYSDNYPRIPAAAITVEDAEMLARLVSYTDLPAPRVTLTMEAADVGTSPSHNIVADLRGSTKPDEIVLIGGHIDSWDVGLGSMDDLGGCVVMWEALNLIARSGLAPRRTIRLLLFTNEEHGFSGVDKYIEDHADEMPDHVLALESDSGAFAPTGFSFGGTPSQQTNFSVIFHTLLAPEGMTTLDASGDPAGSDVSAIGGAYGVATAELQTEDEKYFYYHHSQGDTPDKLTPEGMGRSAGVTAALVYAIADSEYRL